jgi:hypothetical protein
LLSAIHAGSAPWLAAATASAATAASGLTNLCIDVFPSM